jgi:hypothetical protein
MTRTAEPAAERKPGGDRFVLEWIAAKRLTPARKRRVCIEDAEAGADHDRDSHDRDPVRHAHDPVVAKYGVM